MGLLDDLERQAEEKRAAEAGAAADREAREQHWHDSLLPAMCALDDYLQRLARHLAVLGKRPRVVIPLAGYGDVVGYIEPVWNVASSPGASAYGITVDGLVAVASEECPRIVCDTPARCRSVGAVLQPHRLTRITDARRDANGELRAAVYQAAGRIPLQLTIQADCESGLARMQFDNFEGFGSSSRSFRADQLVEPLFDELARFMLREQPHFAREAVADDLRRQLRTRIQRDQLKREWENKLARQLADDEAEVVARLHPSIRPGGLVGRLRMLTRRLTGR